MKFHHISKNERWLYLATIPGTFECNILPNTQKSTCECQILQYQYHMWRTKKSGMYSAKIDRSQLWNIYSYPHSNQTKVQRWACDLILCNASLFDSHLTFLLCFTHKIYNAFYTSTEWESTWMIQITWKWLEFNYVFSSVDKFHGLWYFSACQPTHPEWLITFSEHLHFQKQRD